MSVSCDYCGNAAELVTGREVYPHLKNLWDKMIYRCVPCKARVGCHPGTTNPLGRLADKELRDAKMRAHESFDPLWRGGEVRRSEAYKWLAGQLGISAHDCHIGHFDHHMCNAVVEAVKARKSKNGPVDATVTKA